MALSDPIIFDPDRHFHLIPQITRIHIQAVLQDNAVATFLPPFDLDSDGIDPKVLDYWTANVAQIRTGSRFIVFLLAEGDEVAGYVTVSLASVPTIAHRAGVEKLFVSPKHRRKGIAATLMRAIEVEARSRGKTMLLLDAIRGFPAEHMYSKLGYITIGEVPDGVVLPNTGELRTEVLMYKKI
ncbi:acyl-CoA N-acyltransferase [Elsinoe ampelina]|uniref:Acyl-CoA N-acyltransferase n=1 Tax=Elsinoe ampelina TaxID=302913 RepID=A0A6A6GQ40_9PEZI|nr:acyl-CoA N-acyltransferase [Elsinoe ampelina]